MKGTKNFSIGLTDTSETLKKRKNTVNCGPPNGNSFVAQMNIRMNNRTTHFGPGLIVHQQYRYLWLMDTGLLYSYKFTLKNIILKGERNPCLEQERAAEARESAP